MDEHEVGVELEEDEKALEHEEKARLITQVLYFCICICLCICLCLHKEKENVDHPGALPICLCTCICSCVCLCHPGASPLL